LNPEQKKTSKAGSPTPKERGRGGSSKGPLKHTTKNENTTRKRRKRRNVSRKPGKGAQLRKIRRNSKKTRGESCV